MPDEHSTSFARTFDTHRAALKRYAARFVKSQETAEDIVQDVFAWIWLHWRDVELMENVRAYLYRATRTRSLNRMRDQRAEARRATRQDGSSLVQQPTAEAAVMFSEITLAVEQVLRRMPPRRREVASLRLFEHLSYAEIAAKLSISQKGVEIHLSRAMKTLREQLPVLLGERERPRSLRSRPSSRATTRRASSAMRSTASRAGAIDQHTCSS